MVGLSIPSAEAEVALPAARRRQQPIGSCHPFGVTARPPAPFFARGFAPRAPARTGAALATALVFLRLVEQPPWSGLDRERGGRRGTARVRRQPEPITNPQ